MFKISYIFLISFLILSCSEESEMTNPFYEDYKNEFQVPNFKSIKIDHYLPAFEEGIRAHEKEIINISNNDKNPSFETQSLNLRDLESY